LVGYRVPTEWGTLTEEQRAVSLISGFKQSSKGDFLVQYGAFLCGVVGCWVCGCSLLSFFVAVLSCGVSPVHCRRGRGKEKKNKNRKKQPKISIPVREADADEKGS
jgi:hypothetical protein